jgi:hypothetical protein
MGKLIRYFSSYTAISTITGIAKNTVQKAIANGIANIFDNSIIFTLNPIIGAPEN